MSDLTVKLKLTADGKLLSSEVKRIDRLLENLGATGKRATGEINSGYSKTRAGLVSISKQLQSTKAQILGLFGASALTSFAKSVLQTGDNLTLLDARLRQATGTSERFAQAQQQIQAIARGARADYEATANLYSRLTVSAADYNVTQQQIADTTAAVTYGLKLYGASTQEAQSATLQLSQALASGKLQGDEFRSMAEAAPPLMRALADSLNVPIGALKEMASQGQLTTEVVINALSSQRDAMETAFADMPVTVGEAVGQLIDNIKLKFSEWNDTSEFTKTLAEGILYLADNLGVLVSTLETATYLFGAWAAYRYLPPMLMGIANATRTWATATVALNAAQSGGMLSQLTGGLIQARGEINQTRASLFSLRGAVGVAAAGFAGWQIGKWAYDNFAVVRAVSYAVVAKVVTYASLIPKAFGVAFQAVKSFGAAAVSAVVSKFQILWIRAKNAAIKVGNAFKRMYLSLLKLTKSTIEYIGSGFKEMSANIAGFVAGGLEKIRNGLAGLQGFEVMGQKIDLIPDSVISALDGKISTLKNTAKDTKYVFTGLDSEIARVSASIDASTQNIAINENAIQGIKNAHGQLVDTAFGDFSAKIKSFSADASASLKGMNDDISDYFDLEIAGVDGASDSIKKLTENTKALPPELDSVGNAGDRAGKGLSKAGKGGKKAAKGIDDTGKSAGVAQKALQDLTSKFQSLWEKLDPTVSTSREYAEAQGIVNQAIMAGLVSQAKANELLAIAKEKYTEASSALKKYSAIAELFPKKAKLDKVNKELSQLNRLQKDPAALKQLNKTGVVIAKITQLYEGYKKAIKSGNPELIASFEKQIDSLKKVGEQTQENAKTTKQVFKEELGKLDGVFKNIWTDLLNGSKNFGKALKDWFKNLLAEMAHAAITKPIVMSITGAFAGGANAKGVVDQVTGQVTGQGGGLFSNFNLFGGLSKGIKSFGKDLGITFGDGFADGAAGVIGGAAIGGMLAGLTGGNSTTGSIGGGLGGLAGTLIGGPVGGWIGGALGGVLGGLFGKKKQEKPRAYSYVNVNSGEVDKQGAVKLALDVATKGQQDIVNAMKAMSDNLGVKLSDSLIAGFKIRSKGTVAIFESYLNDPSNKIYKAKTDAKTLEDPKKFALEVARVALATVVNKNVTDFSGKTSAQKGLIDRLQTQESIEALDIKQVTAITTWLKNIEKQARALEATSPQLTGVFEKIKGTAAEYTAGADAIINVTRRFGNEALDNVLNYATSLNDAGDLIGTDLARISNAFIIVSETASQLNLTLPALGDGFVEAADSLVTAMGGIDKYAKITANYYSKYFSKGEQQVKAYGKAQETLLRIQSELGVSSITNAQNFRTYIESLDLTSQAGRDAYATAMQYVDAIYEADRALSVFTSAIDNIQATVGKTIDKINADLMTPEELYNTRKAQAEAMAAELKNLTNPAELQAKIAEINNIVNTMWSSLAQEQKTGMGDWFKSFLSDIQSISTNRVNEIANENGGNEQIDAEYSDARIAWDAAQSNAQSLAQASQAQQRATENLQASVNQLTASLEKSSSNQQSAASSVQQAASSLAGAVASIPSRIQNQVNVSVDAGEVGGA